MAIVDEAILFIPKPTTTVQGSDQGGNLFLTAQEKAAHKRYFIESITAVVHHHNGLAHQELLKAVRLELLRTAVPGGAGQNRQNMSHRI